MANHSQEQHYGNHVRYHPFFHYFSMPLALLLVLGSAAYAIVRIAKGENGADMLLLFLLAVAVANLTVLVRLYGTKVQDRAIRAETALRYYILTGKPLDRWLTVRQIVALRFAGDDELPALSAKAAETGMKPEEIGARLASRRSPDLIRKPIYGGPD